MSTGELLDRTFQLYRQHFVLFLGTSILGPTLKLLANLPFVSLRFADPHNVKAQVIAASSIWVGILVAVLGSAISYAVCVDAVAKVHLGHMTTIAESFRAVKDRMLRVLGIVLAIYLRVFLLMGGAVVLFGVAIALLAPTIRGTTLGGIVGGLAIFAAFVLFAVILIIVFLRYALAVPACVVEKLKINAAIRRSVALTKGHHLRIFAIYLLAITLAFVLTLLLSTPFQIWAANSSFKLFPSILYLIGAFVAGALAAPVHTIGIVLVYFDERVRKEGYDIDLMLESSEGVGSSAVAVANASIG